VNIKSAKWKVPRCLKVSQTVARYLDKTSSSYGCIVVVMLHTLLPVTGRAQGTVLVLWPLATLWITLYAVRFSASRTMYQLRQNEHCPFREVIQPLLSPMSPSSGPRMTALYNWTQRTSYTRAHHRDEKPERDLTYHLICLLIYHGTTTHLYNSIIFF